jgi:glycopeptide antibiotics resistance protein
MQIYSDNLGIDIWFIMLGILAMILIILWRKKHSPSYLVCFGLFGVYLLYVIEKVFFPIHLSGQYVDVMRQQASLLDINLAPFYFGHFTTLSGALPGLILNILLTVPFGFGLNFIVYVKPKHFIWLAPTVGLGIEAIQLIISLLLRYPYRVVDINDFMMNTLGIVIGYIVFRLFSWLYIVVNRQFGIKHDGLSEYIHKIALKNTK